MDKQHEDDKTGTPGMARDARQSAQESRQDAAPEQPRDEARRKLMLRGGVVAGGMAAFAAGYGETVVKAVKGLAQGTAGAPTAHAVRGNSLTPEFRIDPVSGVLSAQPGQTVSPSSCLGCWTQCGVRLRVDVKENRILRVAGNPYHPLATTRPAAMETPVREVYAQLGGDNGLEGRATSCARGSAMLEQLHSPYRVLQPLKRVGPRGAGKWQTISFEQLVQEVCEGGDLFGEGHGRPARDLRPRDAAGSGQPGVRRQGQPVPVHRRVERGPHAADPALRGPVLRHGQFRQPRFVLRTEFPRGRGRRAGRPERHAARQAGLGQRALRPVHRRGAGPGRQPVPAPGAAAGRGARGRRKRASSTWWCPRAAGLVQPVGRYGQ